MHAKIEDPQLSRQINHQILRLTIPNIISNITVPLLSLIDVGLAGHMAHPEAIGSVTVAATITNTIYWLFGFIRLGTTKSRAPSGVEPISIGVSISRKWSPSR